MSDDQLGIGQWEFADYLTKKECLTSVHDSRPESNPILASRNGIILPFLQRFMILYFVAKVSVASARSRQKVVILSHLLQ